ncbi:polysaccharide biosynthesis tyrosine autokinase [Nocardioides aurantiacus]|uniref:Capsular exopolysaccharide synthesis family protein n=1 Tax=Nocardioides aurantiacus TaxID=86796 RepID=A0A3N2CSW0_9ACTN|nr:polysaccharide biosynthesis tyrosine autokinase [Nocardioides aurantiacus]ROR90506.1 capsular exopolysaccharide synthesis family protein [Nocardioides aurantiacus]
MTLRGIWGLVRFNWLTLVAVTAVGAGLGALLASSMTPQYTARSEVFVSVNNGSNTSEIAEGASYSQDQARNFAAVVTREVVLEDIVDSLDLPMTVSDLRDHVSATVPLNTSIITISVVDTSAQRAAAIANSLSQGLAREIPQLAPSSSNSSTPLSLKPVERAVPPQSPSSPHTNLVIVLGALLMLSATVLVLAVRDLIKGKVRSADQAVEITGAPLLGTITSHRALHKRPMASATENALRAEQYRQIRTNLRFIQMDHGHKVFLFTSSIPGEAKSTTAANVAATLAEDGVRVCLVEADLRKPRLAETMNLVDGVGFTSVLARSLSLDDALQPWGDHGLSVLLAGEVPPNPSELLGSSRAQTLLNEIRTRFEVTIIDAPPLIPVTDATLLARFAGGAVMVVSEGTVEVRELRRAVERMGMVDAPVLGTIVTMSKDATSGTYYGSYVTQSNRSARGNRAYAERAPRSDPAGRSRARSDA